MYISELLRVKKCVMGPCSLFIRWPLQPEFRRGAIIIIAERFAEIVFILIAQHLGDVLNFEARIGQQRLGLIHSDLLHILVNAEAELLLKQLHQVFPAQEILSVNIDILISSK